MEADVAVIGAGVNGAVAAWILGRAGLRVAVIDPNALPGGLAGGRVTHGVEGGRYAYALGLVPYEVWLLLGIEPDSLHTPDPSWVELGEDNEPVIQWWSSPSRLRSELIQHGLEAVWRLLHDSQRFFKCLGLRGFLYTPCPPSRWEVATALPRPCPTYLAERTTRSILSETAPRWAWSLLTYPSMLDANGFSLAYYLQNLNIWSQPPGGSMMWLSRLLHRLLREAGATYIQDRAEEIIARGGEAAGVATRQGRVIHAKAVLYAASLPALPRLQGLHGIPESDLRALEALARSRTMVRRLDYIASTRPRPPRRPEWRGWPIYSKWLRGGGEYTYPTLIARRREAPHLVQASGNPSPREPPPGLDPGQVEAVEERTPRHQDQCCSNPTGHPDHIPMKDPYLYDTRPLPGWGDYRTPMPRLYHGSASSYPGGEVNMVAGINAALRILHDLGHPEPWSLLGPVAPHARRGIERCRRSARY